VIEVGIDAAPAAAVAWNIKFPLAVLLRKYRAPNLSAALDVVALRGVASMLMTAHNPCAVPGVGVELAWVTRTPKLVVSVKVAS